MWAQENFWFEKYSSEHLDSKSCTFDRFEKDFCSDFILTFDLTRLSSLVFSLESLWYKRY